MNLPEAMIRTLVAIVALLVRKDYAAVERLSGGTRLSASQLEDAISSYGRTLVMPRSEAFATADVIPVVGARPRAYSVRFGLHTLEEGRSDLELQATLTETSEGELMKVEIDNLLVA